MRQGGGRACVLSEGWSVTKTRCYGINWITFPLTVLFYSSFQRSHLIMTFSSVLYLFFVCCTGTATLMCECVHSHTHRISVRVLIARLSARKPSVWCCCGRQRKQRHGYSNEHPITPAKSHFCVAHTGAKLHSFDLKPLLTQLCRWVISPGDWQEPETMPQALSARSSSFYISLGPSLNTLHSLREWRGTKGEGYKLLIMMPD